MPEHMVGLVSELPPGSKKIVSIGGLEVGVFNVDGDFSALPNRCIHQGGPLCEGNLAAAIVARAETDFRPAFVAEGRVIACPWHGLEFDVTTGRSLAYRRVKLRTYPVVVRDGVVFVVA